MKRGPLRSPPANTKRQQGDKQAEQKLPAGADSSSQTVGRELAPNQIELELQQANARLEREIQERKNLEKAVAEQTGFETMLADLSARFMNVSGGQVEVEFESAQRRACECLGLELSSLWQRVDEPSVAYRLTHFFRPLGGQPIPEPMILGEHFPWTEQQLVGGNVTAFSSFDALPKEAARDVENYRHYGVKASLNLPLSTGGGMIIGLLSFGTIQAEPTWPELLVQRLQLVGNIFSNALARIRLEQALRASEEANRATFEQAAVGIAHMAADGRFLRMNQRFCDIVGYLREEILKRTFQEITFQADLHAGAEHSDRLVHRNLKDYKLEKRYVHRDGTQVWVNLTVSLAQPETGGTEWFVVVAEDITTRKKAEAEVQRQRTDLAHASRVTTLGQLASGLAHELKQPLGAILRNAEAAELFLKRNPPDYEEVSAILVDIRQNDQRAEAVIDRLRSLLKRRDLELEPLSIKDLLEPIVALANGEILIRRAKLEVEIPSDFPAVQGDRVHLQQVFLNLFMNGLDAMDKAPPERRLLRVRVRRGEDQTVEVAVSDQGHGIPEDRLAHLFEPFFTTKSNGLGMGLAITKAIITSHGGRVWAENNPEGGATFRFTLKVAEREGTA